MSIDIKQHDFDQCLDARNLQCPLPLLRARKLLSQMNGSEVLYVITNDLNSHKEFDVFAIQTGHTLVFSYEADGEFHAFLRKRLSAPRA